MGWDGMGWIGMMNRTCRHLVWETYGGGVLDKLWDLFRFS